MSKAKIIYSIGRGNTCVNAAFSFEAGVNVNKISFTCDDSRGNRSLGDGARPYVKGEFTPPAGDQFPLTPSGGLGHRGIIPCPLVAFLFSAQTVPFIRYRELGSFGKAGD